MKLETRRCKSCGALFFEEDCEKRIYTDVPELDGYDWDYVCPECGSTDMARTNACWICGKPIRKGKSFCESCRNLLDFNRKHILAIIQCYKDAQHEFDMTQEGINGAELDIDTFVEALQEYETVISHELAERINKNKEEFKNG